MYFIRKAFYCLHIECDSTACLSTILECVNLSVKIVLAFLAVAKEKILSIASN